MSLSLRHALLLSLVLFVAEFAQTMEPRTPAGSAGGATEFVQLQQEAHPASHGARASVPEPSVDRLLVAHNALPPATSVQQPSTDGTATPIHASIASADALVLLRPARAPPALS